MHRFSNYLIMCFLLLFWTCLQFSLGVLILKIHISVWNEQQMEIFKTAKLTFDFMVTMVVAFIRELWHAHEKIARKILGEVVKFWL